MSKQALNCNMAETNISFIKNSAYICCLTQHKGGGFITLIDDYVNCEIDWQNVFQRKKALIETMFQGNIPSKCDGCFLAQPCYSKENQLHQFTRIDIAPFVPCNCRCLYCQIWKEPSQKDILFVPIIEKMYQNNLIDTTGKTSVSISGGEPTLIKDFDEILYLFYKNNTKTFDINTTGIIYSKAIDCMLQKDDVSCLITVSLDSGNKNLYKKIKNTDAFYIIIENLKKYIASQNSDKQQVRTKYIILPEINDDIENIEQWYNLSKSIGIKHVFIDIEREWFKNTEKLPQKYWTLINFIKEKCEKDNIKLGFYESLRNYMENLHNVVE